MLETNQSKKAPAELGYRMPAEWHGHDATLMHWPSNRETWPGERLERVEQVFQTVINHLHRHEPVVLLAEDETVAARCRRVLEQGAPDWSNIHLHTRKINDVWTRDCGPIGVGRSTGSGWEYALTDWEYNAWGGKYPPYDADNRIPAYIAEEFGLRRYSTDLVLEGGSIETNGLGVFMTTESVLLNPNRNPQLNRNQVEEVLQRYLGAEHVIWLHRGLAGDDTDGHIDDLARFLDEQTILAMVPGGEEDPNAEVLEENLNRLHAAQLPGGEKFVIETLPMPRTRIEGTTVDGSEYVPASYANFYVANGLVLVPTYDQRYDRQALELFQRYFPERDVVGIPCSDLVWGQGAIHCITQQLYGIRI